MRYGKVRPQKSKDHKTAATDGDYFYSHYEADGDGHEDDSGHFSEGDEEHYEGEGEGESEGGHYSEGYEDGPSSYYHESSSDGDGEGEGDSGAYYDEGETRDNKQIIYHGPSGATSYIVRHDD